MLAQGVRRATRYVHFVHYAQTGATRMMTKRATRATPWAVLLGAPEIAAAGHRLPRANMAGMGQGSEYRSAPLKPVTPRSVDLWTQWYEQDDVSRRR